MNLADFPKRTYHVGLCVNDERGHNAGLVGRIDVSPAEDKEWLIDLEHVHFLLGEGWSVEHLERAIWFRYQKEQGAHDELLPLLYEEYESHAGNLLWDRVTTRGRIVLPFLQSLRDSGQWRLTEAPVPVWEWWAKGPHQLLYPYPELELVK